MSTLLDSVLATRLTEGVAEAASADAMCVASLMDMLCSLRLLESSLVALKQEEKINLKLGKLF